MKDGPEGSDGEGGLVTIREYLYPIQAEWARNVLASAGIPCVLPDHHADYLASLVKGVRVQVDEGNAEEAEGILKECEFEMGGGQVREPGTLPEGEEDLPEGAEPSESFEPPPGEPEVADLGDLAAGLPPQACPSCGEAKTRPAPPPDYAAESLLGAFLKRLAGRGWFRCTGCGHVWEAGPKRKNAVDAEEPGP